MNGTFLNGNRIGQSSKQILANSDEIGVVWPNAQIFRFVDRRMPCTTAIPDGVKAKYYIEKVIGCGAFGMVFKAHDRSNCVEYALKRIEFEDPIQDRAAALREANIMLSINHPCILKLHEFFDQPESVCLILDYADGGTLCDRIESNSNGCLAEGTCKFLFYQLCHAIDYLHARHITHRDLKPENILLATSDEHALLKLADFGLSKLIKRKSALRTLVGTDLYVFFLIHFLIF